MKTYQEVIEEAAELAKNHNLKEVYYTEKEEYFSSALEARNSGAKHVERAFPEPLEDETEETEKEISLNINGDLLPDLDTENGHSGDGNSHENTAINTDKNTTSTEESVIENAENQPITEVDAMNANDLVVNNSTEKVSKKK